MQNNDIKFSIIVPVYNVEKYLSKCLDSLVNQTYSNIEIICINDGSTDNSLQILENYAQKDNRIKVINQENQGVSVARNNGIDNATGDYILFVDADDWLEFNACDVLNKSIKKDSTELVIFWHYDIINEQKKSSLPQIKQYNLCNREFYLLENYTSVANYIPLLTLWNKLFKRSFIEQHHLRFVKGLDWFEDGIFIMQYFQLNPKIIIIDNILYNYVYSRNGSLSTGTHQMLLEKRIKSFEIFKKIINGRSFNLVINTFIDSYICETLYLVDSINSYKCKYINLINGLISLYKDENYNSVALKRARIQLLLIKFNLCLLYWKIIRPIGKYCIVLPYRRFKEFLRNKNG